MQASSKAINDYVEARRDTFIAVSDTIWGHPEPRFQEVKSSLCHQETMKALGFRVTADLAGEETAFIAEYGSGKPVIAILGEYDSLSGLSQEADNPVHTPVQAGGEGHGCGHNLLGGAAASAAAALRDYMEANGLPGTIRFYGCPAEENAAGKAFLVRDGYFEDVDIAITWHPSFNNMVSPSGSLANFRVFYTFHGTAAHAAGSPHLGRSALDAIEIMNVGVNYMREHMISEARVHYAVTDAGGTAPNVVQAKAQVLYAMRAPRVQQVIELRERINKIAEGAALITETTVDIKQVSACADYIATPVIAERLGVHLAEFVPIDYTDEEMAYAKTFRNATTDMDRKNLGESIKKLLPKGEADRWLEAPMLNFVAPTTVLGRGSTDVGNVSWVVPTAQFNGATWAAGTASHSWQATAQGKSAVAHKGMLMAAKVMAATALDFLTDPELVKRARESWLEALDGETYPDALPEGYMPEIW